MISISESVELNMSPTEKSWEVKVGLKMIGKKSWEFWLRCLQKNFTQANYPSGFVFEAKRNKSKVLFLNLCFQTLLFFVDS